MAIDAENIPPDTKATLLFSRLGLEGQHIFDNLPSFNPPSDQGDEACNQYLEAVVKHKNTFFEDPSVLWKDIISLTANSLRMKMLKNLFQLSDV